MLRLDENGSVVIDVSPIVTCCCSLRICFAIGLLSNLRCHSLAAGFGNLCFKGHLDPASTERCNTRFIKAYSKLSVSCRLGESCCHLCSCPCYCGLVVVCGTHVIDLDLSIAYKLEYAIEFIGECCFCRIIRDVAHDLIFEGLIEVLEVIGHIFFDILLDFRSFAFSVGYNLAVHLGDVALDRNFLDGIGHSDELRKFFGFGLRRRLSQSDRINRILSLVIDDIDLDTLHAFRPLGRCAIRILPLLLCFYLYGLCIVCYCVGLMIA